MLPSSDIQQTRLRTHVKLSLVYAMDQVVAECRSQVYDTVLGSFLPKVIERQSQD